MISGLSSFKEARKSFFMYSISGRTFLRRTDDSSIHLWRGVINYK